MRMTGLLVVTVLAALARCGASPLRVAVVTGGHDFDRPGFEAMLDSMHDIAWTEYKHPDAYQAFRPEAARAIDAFLFYDMPQEITPAAQADMLALLKAGKPMVFLHHSLGAYQSWPEYRKIIGGRYRINPETVGSTTLPASTFQHGMRMSVGIADPKHPITRGMASFEITDETYGGFDVEATSKPLLTTTEKTSGPVIGWTHTYGKSRIATILLGHDNEAYSHPAFRDILLRALLWSAHRRIPAPTKP